MRNYSFLLLRKRIIINKSGNNYFIHKEDLYSSIGPTHNISLTEFCGDFGDFEHQNSRKRNMGGKYYFRGYLI